MRIKSNIRRFTPCRSIGGRSEIIMADTVKDAYVPNTQEDEAFMREALSLAGCAARLLETPVGAVVVYNGKIVGKGFNRRESSRNALMHAEISAIDEACRRMGGWRLHKCDIYVTLEPCPMCAGAIINARLRRVIFGASDPKAGSFGSVVDLSELPYNHKPEIIRGMLADEASAQLSDFFAELRKRKKDAES